MYNSPPPKSHRCCNNTFSSKTMSVRSRNIPIRKKSLSRLSCYETQISNLVHMVRFFNTPFGTLNVIIQKNHIIWKQEQQNRKINKGYPCRIVRQLIKSFPLGLYVNLLFWKYIKLHEVSTNIAKAISSKQMQISMSFQCIFSCTM